MTRKANKSMKNFTVNKKIWILTILGLIALLIVTGCVDKGKETEGIVPILENMTLETVTPLATSVETTPSATPFETTLVVKKGDKSAPKTPISVVVSMPNDLNLNEVVDINIVVSSTQNAPNTSVELILPEGISLVSDNSTWKVDLVAKTPVVLSAKIVLIKIGQWDVRVLAKKVIDQDNSWGDVDMAYIGYSKDTVPVNTTDVVPVTTKDIVRVT